jgi:excisionase family DNA binding protein
MPPASARDGSEHSPRFLTIADVAEILATSQAQVRSLIRNNELRFIQIGGRNQYRIEVAELENYIQRQYAKTDPGNAPEVAVEETRRPGDP